MPTGPLAAEARSAKAARPKRSVLIIGSEALPFSKTGGLADVLGALPPALARLGWDVTLVVPNYTKRSASGLSEAAAGTPLEQATVTVGGYHADVRLLEAPLGDGARAILVDAPDLYDRAGLYGVGNIDYPDNPRRFGVLVRAALDFAGRQPAPPSIVHAHDWQAGLAPVYLKSVYASHPTLARTPSVLTIHNLAYQGNFEPDWLPRLDLSWDQLSTDRLEYWGKISLLKGGINDARFITTVSPRYAQEIQTPALGFGFDGILRARSTDLVGILNGIDMKAWDPACDEFLPARYNMDDLSGKRADKAAVLAAYGLPADDAALTRPLIGMISRMVDQKGLDLIAAVPAELAALDANWVVLGTGEPRYQDLWRGLARQYPRSIGVRIGFDEPLAHLIEAGADMFLMPSRFEPCGLNQMYSLRYGTLPVVHAVGGLADTVRDGRNGFSFTEYSPAALLSALKRALSTFKNERKWQTMQAAGMKQDYSWDRSAREYVKIYELAIRGSTAGSRP